MLTVKQGVLEPTARVYSDQKYHVLRVVGYMDESFTAPVPIMQTPRNSAKVDKVLIGGETTQESLDNRGLLTTREHVTKIDELTTVVEAQAALEEAQAKINGIDSNPDVFRQYEQLGRGKGRTCRDGRHKGGSGQRN